MIIKIAASDPTHFSELKAQTMNSLAPHVLSLDPVDLEFAQGARDSEFMELAIEQARASTSEEGRISPRVGAVVVKQGEIVARAHRGEFDPGDHAEYTALERKLQNVDLSDATVFTTLEPCTARNHPKLACAQRLIQRGVKRVVIGTLDPNPNIKGEGVMRLREAGISVQLTTPSLMTEIELLNAAFNQQHRAK
jgi:pyrimidine deaminase RibD-like protein